MSPALYNIRQIDADVRWHQEPIVDVVFVRFVFPKRSGLIRVSLLSSTVWLDRLSRLGVRNPSKPKSRRRWTRQFLCRALMNRRNRRRMKLRKMKPMNYSISVKSHDGNSRKMPTPLPSLLLLHPSTSMINVRRVGRKIGSVKTFPARMYDCSRWIMNLAFRNGKPARCLGTFCDDRCTIEHRKSPNNWNRPEWANDLWFG